MRSMHVGTVAELWRYPVKSMAGERLDAGEISWHGVEGDRRWAFVRPGLEGSSFPWLTIREHPEMGRFRPRLGDPGRPEESTAFVRTPDGAELEVTDPALAGLLGDGLRVMKQNRGIPDIAPLSLMTTATIAGLAGLVDTGLDVRRFRPNLLVEPSGDEPFPEDAWVGSVVRIGAARMRIDQRDKRCVMINVDPDTTERDPAVLKAVAREREACLGVYGTTVQPGRVAVGDPVVLEA
jgi:MOSC domain-containing protein